MHPQGGLWYRFVLAVARHLAMPLFGGYRAMHRDRVPMEGPLIVAPVHFSAIDPPLVACAMPRALRFMAKEELFRIPLFGPLIRSVGSFPVRRGAGDVEAIRLALELLRRGHAVLVFPEGARGDGASLLPVSHGVAMLAKRSGALVLPVGISGSERVVPRGAKRPRRARMTVVFGEAMDYADVTGPEGDRAARERFSQALARRLVELTREAGLPISFASEPELPASSPPGETASEPRAP
jgi:1-acyl-sn-glycerol-3-phosphate acyltransferase